jgi:acetolactate decarboxylase
LSGKHTMSHVSPSWRESFLSRGPGLAAFLATGLLWGLTMSAGCAPATMPAQAAPPPVCPVDHGPDALVQFSLLSALAAGDYEDGASLRTVLTAGDFGIGTFDRLEGEMILLDGFMLQALGNGILRPAWLDGTTPFAAVKFFRPDGKLDSLSAVSLEDFDKQLDAKLPRRNSPYALRLEAKFPTLTLRSVPAQMPPFRPLVEVVKDQSTWHHRNLRGTLIGFRCPAWVGTLNVAGYHWHFVSSDRTIGGHVLTCEIADGTLHFDECQALEIRLPKSASFDRFDAKQVDQRDIDRIERQRKAP